MLGRARKVTRINHRASVMRTPATEGKAERSVPLGIGRPSERVLASEIVSINHRTSAMRNRRPYLDFLSDMIEMNATDDDDWPVTVAKLILQNGDVYFEYFEVQDQAIVNEQSIRLTFCNPENDTREFVVR